MVGKANDIYEGVLTFTVKVRFGAPDEEEARLRLSDVAEVISASKLKPGIVYRNYKPKTMRGMPSIAGRSFRTESLDVVE